MKLYYGTSSAPARKVRIVLHEKQLTFESDVVDGLRPAEQFESVSPMLMVPVLEDGDLRLFESNVILEYLLESYAGTPESASPPLSDSMFRVGAHRWGDKKILAAIDTFTAAAINLLVLENYEGLSRKEVSYLERQAARMRACLDWLNDQATPEGFVPGELSIADIALICALGITDKRNLIEWRGRKHIDGLVALHGDRPSILDTRPTDGAV